MKFNLVAVGGTFDHLHLGHEKLLAAAKKAGKKVIVGLCRQSMLGHKAYPQSLQSYTDRKKQLQQLGFNHIVPLTDIYGPAAVDPGIEALVCSPLSRASAEKISQKRQKDNLNYLSLIEVPLVNDTGGKRLASARIRQGLVDRNGFYYPKLFSKNLYLPPEVRPSLQRPFARIIAKVNRPRFGIIAVGDIAAISLLKQKIRPDLAIVDLKTKRRQIFPNLAAEGLKPGLTAPNPAGIITQTAVKQLLNCLQNRKPTLLIDGEEDLLVLPAVLLAPLATTVFYGQPDRGLVKIAVTEPAKTKALRFLEQFT